ncbi:MAG: hypothetical protein GEV03_03540 [Streptosporangiales bacterium]|nr:hypothetical protein [Streptosporangiales bacterium]
MSNVKWGRVVAAGIGAVFVDDLVFAVVPFTGMFLGPVSSWLTPALTALLAFWVGRTVAADAAVRHGVLVGAVAGLGTLIIGLPGFAVLPALLTAVAGALGGAVGRGARPAADSSGDSSGDPSRDPAPRS